MVRRWLAKAAGAVLAVMIALTIVPTPRGMRLEIRAGDAAGVMLCARVEPVRSWSVALAFVRGRQP